MHASDDKSSNALRSWTLKVLASCRPYNLEPKTYAARPEHFVEIEKSFLFIAFIEMTSRFLWPQKDGPKKSHF